MKTTFAAIALVASIASAQLSAIPSCALTCLTDAIGSDGCSGLTDYKCHCSKPSLISDVTPCVNDACSESDIEKTITAVEKLCADAGAPITITQSAAASSAAPSSEAASSAPAETSAAASSAPAVSSPAVYSSAVVTSAVASTGGITYPGSNSTVSSAPIPTFTGGAARVGGGFLAGAMAVVAVAL